MMNESKSMMNNFIDLLDEMAENCRERIRVCRLGRRMCWAMIAVLILMNIGWHVWVYYFRLSQGR